jgi:hypothetical protein
MTRPFPWWIPLGAVILASGYLPTLTAPFDFIDDGNLVYPAPAGTTLAGHADRWWDKVRANVEHLGPFRPTLWVHWELFANTLGGDPLAWRAVRLLWCGLAAAALLALMHALRVHPAAALVAAAAAMWNPYRNEIWTSLTLAEGVAMPYALAALVAARLATTSRWPWAWDVASIVCIVVALGCKNTFASLVPAQVALRLLPDGEGLRKGWRRGRWAAAAYLLPLALPAAHFVYFKMHWHPGQYETPGPSLAQLGHFLRWVKGTAGLDFLGVGVALTAYAVWRGQDPRAAARELFAAHRAAVVCGVLLFVCGTLVYLPLPMVAARYTMPAVWGTDLLFGVLVTALAAAPVARPKKLAWVGLAAGLAAVAVANVGRQDRVAARSRLLWDALHHVEATAPAGAKVAWASGDGREALNVEEGIHFQWHLTHRGRGDVRVMLFDEAGAALARAELPVADGEPDFRVAGPGATDLDGWEPAKPFAVGYRLGAKAFACRVSGRPVPGVPGSEDQPADARLAALMKQAFDTLAAEGKLVPPTPAGGPATAELKQPRP